MECSILCLRISSESIAMCNNQHKKRMNFVMNGLQALRCIYCKISCIYCNNQHKKRMNFVMNGLQALRCIYCKISCIYCNNQHRKQMNFVYRLYTDHLSEACESLNQCVIKLCQLDPYGFTLYLL